MSARPDPWPAEERWRDRDRDPRAGEILAAGVDVGSVSSQAVVLVDGALFAWSNLRNGASSPECARRALSEALAGSGLRVDDLHLVVGTGYGRGNVPFAHKTVSEIHCHARGARFIYGDRLRTVLDVGGQDCKAIRCDARGKVTAFQLNDKCAAGTGRGLEVFAELVQASIPAIGPLSLDVSAEPPPLSSRCVPFARREAAARLRGGEPRARVLAAYCAATARRLVQLLEAVELEPELGITGGVAKNLGVVARIERALGRATLAGDQDPQIAGALGAALFGHARAARRSAGPRPARPGEGDPR